MNIVKKQIAYNTTKRSQKPIYIVIHDTGNTGSGANALSHFNYFNGGDRGASADFFVDDTRVVQVNDYNTYYTWHCGDGQGKYGVTNGNSVGVEICINSDGNYDKAFQNAVELTKQLMSELNIPIERVVRHYDASRKNCPASMHSENWSVWETFLAQLAETKKLVNADEITWELNYRHLNIDDMTGFIKALDKAKAENSPLYWGYYKLVNGGKEYK